MSAAAASLADSLDADGPKARGKKHSETLKAVTLGLIDLYKKCSSEFSYTRACAPQRVLTKLNKGVHNQGVDNAEYDYICRVGDCLHNPRGGSYEIVDWLGHGTFGQVVKCKHSSGRHVALKIIKNKSTYYSQALVEVRILQMLNKEYDPDDECRIVRMLDYFVYKKHICIAFELLSLSIYDMLKQNSFRGIGLTYIRLLAEQLLFAMRCLRDAGVIHCDLKPENVLVTELSQQLKIKLIDFGSACAEYHTLYSYIQSRFYRSPEVLLGMPYTIAIDMWSFGCICAELYLGLPIFPGQTEYDMAYRFTDILGLPPVAMLEEGKCSTRFFVCEQLEEGAEGAVRHTPSGNSSGAMETDAPDASADGTMRTSGSETGQDSGDGSTRADSGVSEVQKSTRRGAGRRQWRLKTRQEFETETGKPLGKSKKYFNFKSLPQMMPVRALNPRLTTKEQKDEEKRCRLTLLQLLTGCLEYNPKVRWTPKQALSHGFVTGDRYEEDFRPIPDESPSAVMRAPPSPMRAMGGCSSASSTRSTPPRSITGVSAKATTQQQHAKATPPGMTQHASPSGTPGSSRTPLMVQSRPGQGALPPSSSGVASHTSSPWHVPSPAVSQRSTASHASASQPNSGSECWGQMIMDECASEDPSQSDTSGSHWPSRSAQASDSDCNTPQSHGRGGGGYPGARSFATAEEATSRLDQQQVAWHHLKQKIALRSEGRLRMDTAMSPGSSGAGGNFREAVGMNDSGPVTFVNQGARRDPRSANITPQRDGEDGVSGGNRSNSAPGNSNADTPNAGRQS
eukprot:TRINITY_DN44849_c0_g1_i1.p1 TRINITY_DN44849_c0_g1~~TRINITY_DN44849_c0_g1_i1.p1  ORF type:complete len:794 (-),score=172.47 TRINITY_DN44849_c0_g1_i1:166-2547(-)